jgi:hypothetical protein
MELFDIIKCSSETEEVSKKVLTRLPLTWRSAEFSTLARQLDEIHIHKNITTKGRRHVQAFTLEFLCQTSTSSPPPTDYTYVPQNLPLNCYSNEFLDTLPIYGKQLLNPKPIVDFPKLLGIAKHFRKSSYSIYLS